MPSPSMGADLPYLTPDYETSVPNLFIVGELGGLALIKNAVNQGRDCVDTIADRLAKERPGASQAEVYDVLIVGAGPAGISASVRAIERSLSHITLERDEVGGTVAKYPRQKLVMTSPVQFPMYGKFKKLQLSKENLLAFWNTVLHRADFNVVTGKKVDDIKKGTDGIFTITTANTRYRARAVVLARKGRFGEIRVLLVGALPGGLRLGDFFGKVGVSFGLQYTPRQASNESKQSILSRKQLAETEGSTGVDLVVR